MHAPCETHMLVAHKILKGLLFSKHGYLEVEGYTNVDWVESIVYKRSISKYCTFVNLVT